MTDQLIKVAEQQGWEIDRNQLDQLVQTADGAIGSDAVHAYARCISFLMDQFRNQN